MSVCCMEILGEKSKTQTVGWNINRLLGSLVFTVPDLHISSWLFLYSLYCVSPRDCCFVTFCTIVLAGFVLHTILKKFHTILCLFFFFFHIYFFPHKFHIEASHPALRDLAALEHWLFTTLAMCLLNGMTYVDVLQHLLMVTINDTSPRKSQMNKYEHPKFIWGSIIN